LPGGSPPGMIGRRSKSCRLLALKAKPVRSRSEAGQIG